MRLALGDGCLPRVDMCLALVDVRLVLVDVPLVVAPRQGVSSVLLLVAIVEPELVASLALTSWLWSLLTCDAYRLVLLCTYALFNYEITVQSLLDPRCGVSITLSIQSIAAATHTVATSRLPSKSS